MSAIEASGITHTKSNLIREYSKILPNKQGDSAADTKIWRLQGKFHSGGIRKTCTVPKRVIRIADNYKRNSIDKNEIEEKLSQLPSFQVNELEVGQNPKGNYYRTRHFDVHLKYEKRNPKQS